MKATLAALAASTLAIGCTTVYETPLQQQLREEYVKYHLSKRQVLDGRTADNIIQWCDQLRFARGTDPHTNCLLRGMDRFAVDPGIAAQRAAPIEVTPYSTCAVGGC